ncbi:MAG: yxeP 1 [Anaerosporomusa subterranea]|jgi:amidohydrolase|nr:yxeP 1 [Anaerosporomusa subterranea]
MDFLQQAQVLLPSLIAIRRQLHMFPELSWQEVKTTQTIAEFLHQLGLEVVTWEGETGLVAILQGDQQGATVALRADIDALPIDEKNAVCYRSQNTGVMHACGHDAHVACALGAAAMLVRQKHLIKGTIKFIFQPAEETGGGASLMIKRGVFTDSEVGAIFALHSQPELPTGTIGLKSGPVMAANDPLFITITGKGGHGALPQQARDPIIVAAAIIQALQTVVSRQIDPLAAAVISFGTIAGGTASNIIPECVEMTGILRTIDPELRAKLRNRIKEIVEQVAKTWETEATVWFEKGYPAVINPVDLVSFCQKSLQTVIHNNKIVAPMPVMVTEDFSEFQEQVPGVLLWLGVGHSAEGETRLLHNPHFDIDESALAYGAAVFAQLAFDYLDQA